MPRRRREHRKRLKRWRPCQASKVRLAAELWPVLKELVVSPPKTRRVPAVDLLEEALRIAANVRTAREMAVPH